MQNCFIGVSSLVNFNMQCCKTINHLKKGWNRTMQKDIKKFVAAAVILLEISCLLLRKECSEFRIKFEEKYKIIATNKFQSKT